MRSIIIRNYIKLSVFCLVSMVSCQKFLDVKSNAKLVVPKTLSDLQALLDYEAKINRTGVSVSEASTNDYFLTDQDYAALSIDLKRLYIWEKDNILPRKFHEWGLVYERVFAANNVLDNMDIVKPTPANQTEWNDIKAQALFIRSFAFLEIATTWALAYDPSTADKDLGIPLRLTSDINEKITRSTVKQTYDRILKDLNEAVALSNITPIHPIRTSKPAVYALLARTYLAMRDYENCLKNADLCLQLKNDLLDFNNNPPLNPSAVFPFSSSALMYKNSEIIYASRMNGPSAALANSRAKINNDLYQSYDVNDLRKKVYFKDNNNQTFSFKGSLEGTAVLFNGIATDEVYLMRAECYARKGMVTEAMNDLNILMRKRWDKNVDYPTFAANNPTQALEIILKERRKELIMRGTRWMDIKRLNKEGANIILQRTLNGQTFTLPANDNRYALAIPEDVIDNTNIPQNPR